MSKNKADLSGTNEMLRKALISPLVLQLPSRAKGLSVRANMSEKKRKFEKALEAKLPLSADEAEFVYLMQEITISLTETGQLTVGKTQRSPWGIENICKQFAIEKPKDEALTSQEVLKEKLEQEAKNLVWVNPENPYY
jgi:hypothetical protein